MEPKVNYTLVGIFIILLSVVLFVIILWLTTLHHGKEYLTYGTDMKDVAGLGKETPVRLSGVRVGYIQSIFLNKNNPQVARLLLQIEKGTPITTATIATIKSEGITGVDYLSLRATSRYAPLLKKPAGEPYPLIPSEPSFLAKISTSLQEVTDSLKDVSQNINAVFDPENRRQLRSILSNLNQITQSIKIGSQDLPKTIRLLKKTLNTLNTAALSFTRTNQTVSSGLSNQILPSTQSLLIKINETATHLQALSQDLKQNPSILIRGKYPPLLGPGEK